MDLEKKIKIELEVSKAMGAMLELAVQEFVRSGGKLGDGLAVNDQTKEELMAIAKDILEQISEKRNFL